LDSDFSRPFSYGDNIEVEVQVLKLGRTSITFGYRVFKEGEADPRIVGHNVTVCLDMDSFQKTDIPVWLRRLFEEQLGESLE
jgi:4-hydroxybenzoyl-CoA thioesterase